MVAMAVQTMIIHSTPWIVCEPCSSLVDADANAARRFAASDTPPPGCGPADQHRATFAAGRAWSLMYNEWPTSVQIGNHAVTHDPAKGSRCDFCRRIVYGDEKFGMFAPQMYEELLAKGARFLRSPAPDNIVKGDPYFIACMICMEHAGIGGDAAHTAG